MDGTITWMLVFAGATIALLGGFLVVSEKELRKKRGEAATLAAKLSRINTSTAADDYQNNLAKLEKASKELQEQLSAAVSRLDSTEHEFAQLESECWRLKNLETEKRQLEVSNQKLSDEISALRQQLNSALKVNDDSQFERAAFDEQLATTAIELKSITAKLAEAKTRIEELENSSNLSAPTVAERSLPEPRVEFENDFKALQRELADREDKLQAFDTVNRQLLELEQKYDRALLDNRQLEQKISCYRERISGDEAAQRDFAIIRQQMDDSPLQASISDDPAQMQFDMAGQSENHYGSRHAGQTGIILRSAGSPGLTGMDGLESYGETTALHTSIEYVEPSHNENKSAGMDLELRQSEDRRTAQLSHLLAWVRLHGSDTYREQIDSLKDFTDFSERERQVVRDIFLARADESQKRGRDDEMLRYRTWAKNIVYHTRFADEEIEPFSENGTTENNSGYEASSNRAAMIMVPATTNTNAGKAGLTTVQPDGIKSAAGNVALGIGIGLGLVLILLLQLFFDTSAEITVASDDASPPARSQTAELPKTQQSKDPDRAAVVSANTADAEALRPEERVKSKPDDVKAAVRNTGKEPAAKTTRSQSMFGAYTIVKPTPVYSEASEQSALITSLDPGTQVNVVAARRGWYEIRSRTGRPPGFIRRDGASRNR